MSSLELQAHKEVIAENMRNNFFAFAKYCLGYKDITPRTHGELIECLERDSKRKLIVMPRGTFKSSLGVVAYSIWMLTRNPNLRIMIDSEVYTNSKNFIREIKHHMQSESLTSIFGDFVGPTWTEGELTIKQRTKNFKEASITASGMGAIKVGQHFDIIIHDDMNSGNNSETPEMRQKVIRHYQLNTAILEPHGTMVIIGTRYSADDLIGTIIDVEVNNEQSDGLLSQPLQHTQAIS